jgi:hypothetical protein
LRRRCCRRGSHWNTIDAYLQSTVREYCSCNVSSSVVTATPILVSIIYRSFACVTCWHVSLVLYNFNIPLMARVPTHPPLLPWWLLSITRAPVPFHPTVHRDLARYTVWPHRWTRSLKRI